MGGAHRDCLAHRVVSPGLSGRVHPIPLQPPDYAAAGRGHGLPAPARAPRGQRAPGRPPPRLGRGAQAAALLAVRDAVRQRVTVRAGRGQRAAGAAGRGAGGRRLPAPRKEPLSLPVRPSVRPSVQSRHPCLSKALTTTPAPAGPRSDLTQGMFTWCSGGEGPGRAGGAAGVCGSHTRTAGAARDPKQDDHPPPTPLPPPLTHLEPKSKLSSQPPHPQPHLPPTPLPLSTLDRRTRALSRPQHSFPRAPGAAPADETAGNRIRPGGQATGPGAAWGERLLRGTGLFRSRSIAAAAGRKGRCK